MSLLSELPLSETRSCYDRPLLAATEQIAVGSRSSAWTEYAERFAENGIDVSVLRYLTEQYLEKIGILLGYRPPPRRQRVGPSSPDQSRKRPPNASLRQGDVSGPGRVDGALHRDGCVNGSLDLKSLMLVDA